MAVLGQLQAAGQVLQALPQALVLTLGGHGEQGQHRLGRGAPLAVGGPAHQALHLGLLQAQAAQEVAQDALVHALGLLGVGLGQQPRQALHHQLFTLAGQVVHELLYLVLVQAQVLEHLGQQGRVLLAEEQLGALSGQVLG
ncbi:MAG: hypothetical protein HY794_02925 [Desulfarculus sp.]|nr:hypothetical protein [Desulfarculus sp.]